MILGIMGAMEEETAGIYQFFAEQLGCHVETVVKAGRHFHCFTYQQHHIYLVFSRWGKVAAAITATILMGQFSVDSIIFTGVAGAAKSALNIGDIVIGDRYIQHDVNAEPLFPKFHVPLTNTTYFCADDSLLSIAKTAAEDMVAQKDKIALLPIADFQIDSLSVYTGTLASGDQFITDHNIVEQLLVEIDDLYAVDMESAAVAQVCVEHNVGFVTVRIISDSANGNAHIDFPKFIKHLSSPLTQLIVEHMCSLLLPLR